MLRFRAILPVFAKKKLLFSRKRTTMTGPDRPFRRYWKAFLGMLFAIFDVFIHRVFRLVYGGAGTKCPPIRNVLLLESATSIARKIRHKKLTSLYVVNSFIERIGEINPAVNCVVADRFEKARTEAKAVDELINSGTLSEEYMEKEKPFLGVPFTTKDCLAIKGMIHTAGLYKRKHIVAEEDADAVSRLRNAGAIPLALTNVSELCMWWESANTIHGRTSNPYDTNRIVGGSSGGEGCIQGAAASAFGLGSDIGGSTRMPSFFNGVFGHKPSKFVVSNNGQYPIPFTEELRSYLGIGPMCRRAEDLLPIFKLIVSSRVADLRLDEKVDISGVRFFYQETDGGGQFISPVNPEIRELFRRIVAHLQKAHKIKAKQTDIKRLKKSCAIWFCGMKAESGPTFQDQLANLEGGISLPMEFAKWCFRRSKHTFVGLSTALMEKGGPKYGSPVHRHMMEERDALRQEIRDLLGDDGVFLYPTHPTPAPYHNEPLFKPFNFAYTGIFNVLGFPATHCPLGLSKEGLPIGVQVIANDKNDRLCLAVARELEKAFGGWVPPGVDV